MIYLGNFAGLMFPDFSEYPSSTIKIVASTTKYGITSGLKNDFLEVTVNKIRYLLEKIIQYVLLLKKP